eukprot:808107_1
MLVKVVVVGDKSVGKSSLIKSFINRNENDVFSVEDVNHTTNVRIQHTQFVIQFSEKAGWEKEEQEPKQPDLKNGFNFYRYNTENEINVQVIVYDVTNEQSFDFINKWIYGNRTDAPTILIANKCDIFPNDIHGKEKILSYGYCRNYGMVQIIQELCAKYYGQKKTGQEYAKQNNMKYFEVSTMDNDIIHINAVFKCISELALAHNELSEYRDHYDMLQDRAGSFRPTIWKAGYEKIVGEPPNDDIYDDSIFNDEVMQPQNKSNS